MESKVTVSTDGGVQKTLTGKQADRVKAGVQRHLDRGTAAPIKPGKHMTSRKGRAPKKGGVELPAGDVSIDASTELVRGARLALAEAILRSMTRKDERSAQAKANKQIRRNALGRAGRQLRGGNAGSGGRMGPNFSDNDVRVARAVQQRGTPFERTLAQRQAADTRPNKGASNLRNQGVRAKTVDSTDVIRGARLALAERIISEMYSGTVPKGSKARRDMSNKVGMERIVRRSRGGAQKTADVLRSSVDKVLNSRR